MTSISWFEVARFFGAALGAALLWGILGSAIKRKGSPPALIFLLGAVALWFSMEGLRILIAQAAPGSPAADYAATGARLGLAFTPAALVATFLALAHEAEMAAFGRLQRYLITFIVVLGAAAFVLGEVYAPAPQAILAFGLYLIFALTVSAYFCLRLAHHYEMEVHRRFYGQMAIALTGIAILVGIHGSMRDVGPPGLTQTLSLVLFLTPVAPAFIVAYFAYRYSFFRIVVNPALFYSALTGIVLIVYLLGIRRVADQFRDIGSVRPEVIEAVLLTLLVFLFQPVKNRLQRFINRLFFQARYEYQHLLGELSHALNIPLAFEQRLQDFVDALGSSLKVHVVSLTLIDREDGNIENVRITASRGLPGFDPPAIPLNGPEDRVRIEQLVEWLSTYRRPLDTGELHRWRFVTPLVSQGVQLCIPVLREDEVIGFLCLGEKKRDVPFSGEERELLATLSNQIALAVENARLVDARLAMERRMFEAERLSSLGLLSASIAHEVKNPLSSIKTIAAVLREDLRDNPTAAEDLSIVLSEVDRLTRVVDRLLRFARPQTDGALHSVPLKDVLDDVVLILSHEAERHKVDIRSELEEDLVVLADREALQETLFNLILNATEAISADEEGSIVIAGRRLPHVPSPGDGGQQHTHWVEITVADTGPGIPADIRPQIFEPFYTTKVTGTGLGLATVKRAVERMGGTVSVTSGEDGRGAMFAVRLPGGNG